MCERRERAAQLRNKESKCQWIRPGGRVRQQDRLKECKVVYGWPRCVSMQLEREHTLTRTPAKTRARRLRQKTKQCEHIHDRENCTISFKKWQEIINSAPKTVSQCSSIKQNLTFEKLEQAKTDVTVVTKALSQRCLAHLVHFSVAYNPIWCQVAQLHKIIV